MRSALRLAGLSLCALAFLAPVAHAQEPAPTPEPPRTTATAETPEHEVPPPESPVDTEARRAAVTIGASRPADVSIPGNPAATNVFVGNGDLGRALGLDRYAVRLAGVNLVDVSADLLGGVRPGGMTVQNLFILDATVDLEKLWGWKGGKFGAEFLDHRGSRAGTLTGDLQSFNGLDGGGLMNRSELYQLWVFKTFFKDRLSVRLGKVVPTYQFGNIADVTSLIMTPIFVMPTVLGRMPGYPDSATGITLAASPVRRAYGKFGFYDGRVGGSNVNTGLKWPSFNGQYFFIGEAGLVYRLGGQQLDGKFGIGGWQQTGQLKQFSGGTQDGTSGMYLFAKQRLKNEKRAGGQEGLDAYFQFGLSDPDVQLVQRYVGAGFTWTGPIPGRDRDSAGLGFARGRITNEPGAAALFPQFPPGPLPQNETILQAYYQLILNRNMFVQSVLTGILNPGKSATIPDPFVFSQRLGFLF